MTYTPKTIRVARMAEIEKRLGPPCDISLLALARHYARPFEDAFETLNRLMLLEAITDGDGDQRFAAKQLRTYPVRLGRKLGRYGANYEEINTAVGGTA